MIYQRYMPREELFKAQLEMLMQNGRLAMVVTHLVGVAATLMMFWPIMGVSGILFWAGGFLVLLLLRSLHMTIALRDQLFRSRPMAVYWQLLAGAMLTGSAWSGVYIFAADSVPVTMQYVFLLLLVSMAAFSIGYSVIVREYFLAHIFTSLWPVAWWCTVHYWQQPYNLLIGLSMLAYCALLILVCNQAHKAFRNMISLNWEREQTAQELGDLTTSLRDRNRQLRDARAQLTNLANIDELTGLGNRRLANSVLQDEMNRARRADGELSIILLDVDYFKNYNDSYGHPAGDAVLKTLAGLMRRACGRAGEVVARYGGEEFLLILPGAGEGAALRTATRLQELVLEEKIPHRSSDLSEYLTISQGVVTVKPDQNLEPEALIQRADDALYRAKNAGRDAIAAD